jgi:D-glycero-D-manno-heptose 1,7-bisphosphate phosphatase
MTKILFLDLDGTVRQTKSGATFINDPYDQQLIPGVEEAIIPYRNWVIIGITNQGGVGAGFKTLENCILEQEETLRLIPELRFILFCPDNDGLECFMVERLCVTRLGVAGVYEKGVNPTLYPSHHLDNSLVHVEQCGYFRKPNCGMVVSGRAFYGSASELLMIGDRPEDQECAKNANIPFMLAHEWRGDAKGS